MPQNDGGEDVQESNRQRKTPPVVGEHGMRPNVRSHQSSRWITLSGDGKCWPRYIASHQRRGVSIATRIQTELTSRGDQLLPASVPSPGDAGSVQMDTTDPTIDAGKLDII